MGSIASEKAECCVAATHVYFLHRQDRVMSVSNRNYRTWEEDILAKISNIRYIGCFTSVRERSSAVRTMIEQDLGADPATGAPLRRLHEITTEPEDYPDLAEGDVEDLHSALVELERLDAASREMARAAIASMNAADAACIRRAVFMTRDRTLH
jgi:hypothetical protein